MKELCVLCHRIHEGFNWQYGPYETADGTRYGWFCDKYFKPSPSPEFTTSKIKEDRKKYFNTLVQPWREGVPSKEYIEAHGSKNFTKEEVKNSKYVWKDLKGWDTRRQSK